MLNLIHCKQRNRLWFTVAEKFCFIYINQRVLSKAPRTVLDLTNQEQLQLEEEFIIVDVSDEPEQLYDAAVADNATTVENTAGAEKETIDQQRGEKRPPPADFDYDSQPKRPFQGFSQTPISIVNQGQMNGGLNMANATFNWSDSDAYAAAANPFISPPVRSSW